jgi:hypothetical protein
MDYSAAVIPVTKADKKVDNFNKNYEPLNDIDRKNWAACKSTLSNLSSWIEYETCAEGRAQMILKSTMEPL